jgi:dienelactone hydrolase
VRRGLALIAAVVALVATGCTVPKPPGDSPLRYRDAIFTDVTKTADLQYGQAPDASGNPVVLRLDLYQPTGDTQTKRPALVWVHGGGFSGGDKTNIVPVDVANTFAKLGYVVVSINYRLLGSNCVANPSGCTTAAIEAQHDAQAAVRWLRANASTYKIDATRIGIGGESAGAITSALVGMHSEDVGSSGNPGFPSTVGGFVSVSGGLPQGLFASHGDAWALLLHGTADNVVSPDWSAQTEDALLKVGVPAWVDFQIGAGHVPWAQYRSFYLEQADWFLYHALDLAHANGQPTAAARAEERLVKRYRAAVR